MKNAFRNPVLQRLHAMSAGQQSQWRQVRFTVGEVWSCPQDKEPEIWFAEEGAWVLEQKLDSRLVEVALIDAAGGVLLPEPSQGRVRALLDGYGYALPMATVASISHELLLQAQQHLMQQMAVWAYCATHHGSTQALADRIWWMLQTSAVPRTSWPVDGLPGGGHEAAQANPAVRELQLAGAVEVQGGLLQVLDASLLRRMACGCHTSRAATASATLMPSTPADRMPPA